MYKLRSFISLFFLVLLFLSCKKDEKIIVPDVPVPNTTGQVVFDFKAFVYNQPLMANKWYLNFNADSFTVRKFNYYISNIRLKRDDGMFFSETESYHLLRHIDGKEVFTVSKVPEGTYTSIEFIIGVDSARNVSGAQTGDLDVNELMFWEWNTGYVFFKLEGDCNVATNSDRDDFAIHVGGFSGRDNALQKCSFVLTAPLNVAVGKNSNVFYQVAVDEIFKNPSNLDIESIINGGGASLKAVSDNYRDMFKVDRVQN